MKETKVYVDRDLLSSFYTRSGTDNIQAEIKFKDTNKLYLYDIKTHDRELVKEVCEKIKQDCWCGGAILEDDYYKVPVKYLQNLQKEIEK